MEWWSNLFVRSVCFGLCCAGCFFCLFWGLFWLGFFIVFFTGHYWNQPLYTGLHWNP